MYNNAILRATFIITEEYLAPNIQEKVPDQRSLTHLRSVLSANNLNLLK